MSKFVTALLLVAVVFVLHQTEIGAQQESTPSCPVNETWWRCGSLCWENKCHTPRHRLCPVLCVPGACACAPNYYRNEVNNECVLLQDCP